MVMGRIAYKLDNSYLQRRVRNEGGNYAQVTRAVDTRKDGLAKEGVRGKKPMGAIQRTSHVMREDRNTTCCRRSSA